MTTTSCCASLIILRKQFPSKQEVHPVGFISTTHPLSAAYSTDSTAYSIKGFYLDFRDSQHLHFPCTKNLCKLAKPSLCSRQTKSQTSSALCICMLWKPTDLRPREHLVCSVTSATIAGRWKWGDNKNSKAGRRKEVWEGRKSCR